MVNDTINVAVPPATEQPHPSLSRCFKHACYLPWHTKRFINAQLVQQITQAVTQAETGHFGEIQVIIEGHLTPGFAYRHDTTVRAYQLFAQYGVWDTAHNTGILLYINLCARRVEIVADRGIYLAAGSQTWVDICQQVTVHFTQGRFGDGILHGIKQLGDYVQRYHTALAYQSANNERPDAPIIL